MHTSTTNNFFELVNEIDKIVFPEESTSIVSAEVKPVLKGDKELEQFSNLGNEQDDNEIISTVMDDIGINTNDMQNLKESKEWTEEDENAEIILQLKEAFPGFEINVKQIFCSILYDEDQIISLLKKNLPSLSAIQLTKKEVKIFPFLLHNVEYLIEDSLTLPIHNFNIPIYRVFQKEDLRFYPAGKMTFDKTIQSVENKWTPLLNALQRSLIEEIKSGKIAEKKTEKVPLETLSALDYTKIKDSLSNSIVHIEKNISGLMEEKNQTLNFSSFWETEEQFLNAIAQIQEQIVELESQLKKEDEKIKEEYVELKKIQVSLNEETKRYKQLEKQGIQIERETKGEIAKKLDAFQKRKQIVQKRLNDFKSSKNILEKFVKLIQIDNIKDFEENFRLAFSEEIDKAIKLLDKTIETNKNENRDKPAIAKRNIDLHILWVPVYLTSFTASQADTKIGGSVLYSDLLDNVFLVIPSARSN